MIALVKGTYRFSHSSIGAILSAYVLTDCSTRFPFQFKCMFIHSKYLVYAYIIRHTLALSHLYLTVIRIFLYNRLSEMHVLPLSPCSDIKMSFHSSRFTRLSSSSL